MCVFHFQQFWSDKPSKFIQLTYAIDDNPPWYMALFLGFQVNINRCTRSVVKRAGGGGGEGEKKKIP